MIHWLFDWLKQNGDAVTALAAIIALVFGIWQVLSAKYSQREASSLSRCCSRPRSPRSQPERR